MNKKKNSIDHMLKNISKDYNIPLDDLLKYYLSDNRNENLDKINICKARKQDGLQCTRKSKLGNVFCGKHIENRKWGCIMDSDIIELTQYEFENKILYLDELNLVYEKNI